MILHTFLKLENFSKSSKIIKKSASVKNIVKREENGKILHFAVEIFS